VARSGRELRDVLRRIDGRGYKAYRDIEGEFELGACSLGVDRVQGDPFAAPSRVRVRLPRSRDALPACLSASRPRRIALADHLARRVRDAIRREPVARRGSGRSGAIAVDAGGQEVLERSAVAVDDDWVEARLQVGLPAAGRRVLGREAEDLLCEALPRIAAAALGAGLDADAARRFVECVEAQESVRARLGALGLVAFVGNGSLLPRESGASERPLDPAGAVAFESPDSLRVEIPLPDPIEAEGVRRRSVVGMGLRKGVTLIVGGGYHGKSTLLRALARGVYPHVPGDGREWVVSAPGLVQVRAEDGRRVERVDISAFIGRLPGRRRTDAFSSDDASGSTSQAAGIVEALEAGASGLLLDEDTSATNLLVRDARMRALVPDRHEPITPFLERVRELHERLGVSTLLVMGGVGDYFAVADCVLMMREFRPYEVTAEARRIAAEGPPPPRSGPALPLDRVAGRIPVAGSLDASRDRRAVRIEARGVDALAFGGQEIDLRGVEQLVDPSQTRAVGCALHLAAERFADGRATLGQVLDRIEQCLDERGLDVLDPWHRPGRHPGELARPRRFEVAAALNRLRSLRMRGAGS
jgi:predicted ABC-class ATPase